MKYKALLVDVDGTLISHDLKLSPKVVTAIKRVSKRIPVGICSGRAYVSFKEYLKRLGLNGLHIAFGGAQIVEYPSGKVMEQDLINEELVQRLYRRMSKIGCVVTIQDDQYQYQDKRRILDLDFPARYKSIRELKDWNVPKIVIYGLDEKRWKVLSGFPDVHVAKFRYRDFELDWADITAKKVNKQSAVLKWAKLVGVRRKEIVAVGDGYNDYPMLMAAGLKVAMGNAVKELKEIADFICPSVDEDGLVTVIEKFFNA